MQEFHGSMRGIRSSPKKLNLVARLVSYYFDKIMLSCYQIRKMSIAQALAQVEFCEKKAGDHIKMVHFTFLNQVFTTLCV